VKRSPRKPATGEKAGPERLGEVLSHLFVARGWGRRLERLQLEMAWAQAAGPTIAAATQLGNLRRGVMEVIVGNAALLQELAHFQKRSLLEAFQARTTAKVSDLRFRIGVVNDSTDSSEPTDGLSRE
jgi:predicted nucleic acid-binding Zn ribbon protein